MCDEQRAAPFSAAETDAVQKIWRDLGLPGIIDVHTHFMPQNVMNKVWGYFDEFGAKAGVEWPITYRTDEDKRVETLRGFGVRAYSSMIYPHKPDMAQWLNGWGIEFATAHPDCLQTATFYPESGVGGYVASAIEAGAEVFKSHIQVGEYAPNDPLLDDVWGLLSETQVPVVIHCGSGPAPGTYTGPEPIAELLGRFPNLPLIIAHMGMPEYEQFMTLAEKYPEVRLDTTMAFTDFVENLSPLQESLKPRLRDLGDKVLFGSDFPNIPYGYPEALTACDRLDLGDDWLRGVFYNNAAALFGRK
ncbi:MAG: amidohydrolase family protein [Gordonia sp. (in: high G+C Gram-positive bacteria)]|uniref:amidohydrolase family protein n=1 Tax=Gordonia sp. (in: high G+C Gram-positive bacteria) TaxID=84139 RepID=UPI003C766D72